MTEYINKGKLICALRDSIQRYYDDRHFYNAVVEFEKTIDHIKSGEFDAKPERNCAMCRHGVFPIKEICRKCTDTNNKWEPKEPMQNSDICDRAYLNQIFSTIPRICSLEKRINALDCERRRHVADINILLKRIESLEKPKSGCTSPFGMMSNYCPLENQRIQSCDRCHYWRDS